jgi:hypothetical protein
MRWGSSACQYSATKLLSALFKFSTTFVSALHSFSTEGELAGSAKMALSYARINDVCSTSWHCPSTYVCHIALNEKLLTEFRNWPFNASGTQDLSYVVVLCTSQLKKPKCCAEDVKEISTLNSPVNKVNFLLFLVYFKNIFR